METSDKKQNTTKKDVAVAHKNVHVAFLHAQRNMSNAVKGTENPFLKAKYADLNSVREAVLPALLNEGIYVTQIVVREDGKSFIRTLLVHAESDTSMSTDVEILTKAQNDAQAQGSAITYARRYGLQTICGIGAEDDDGKRASAEPTTATQAIDEDKIKSIGTYGELIDYWRSNDPLVADKAKFKELVMEKRKEFTFDETSENWEQICKQVAKGETTIEELKSTYFISDETKQKITDYATENLS